MNGWIDGWMTHSYDGLVCSCTYVYPVEKKKIEWMDHVGMDSIVSQEPGAFAKYIKLYKNTICGRHPIAVYLSALKENKESGVEQVQIHFVKYAQSSQVKYDHESSVSYASAVIRKV